MATWSASKKTETLWRERVDQWRASGATAAQFSEHRGFAPTTLKYWAYRLKQSEEPRFVRLVPRSASAAAAPEVTIEVGGARVRVTRGFDAALLADVVRALGQAAR